MLRKFGGRTRTRTLDPLIKSPSRAVILKELFSQRVAKRRLKGQYLAVYFPNGTALAQVQRRQSHEALKAASAATIYRETAIICQLEAAAMSPAAVAWACCTIRTRTASYV